MPTPSSTGKGLQSHNGSISGNLDIALCRSILYEALALGFRPPTPEIQDRLVSPAGASALGEAARLVDWNGGFRLESRVRGLARFAGMTARLEEAYIRLFGHSVRGGIPLYETEYGQGSLFQQPQELADLGGFLRAFGLVQREEAHERIDHVSCECEFMLFLARKEAYAMENGETEMLETTQRTGRQFLKDHLGRFGPTLARLLARQDPDGFFGALGDLFHEFIRSECTRFRVKMGSQGLILRKLSEDNLSMTCGFTAELLEIGSRPAVRKPE